ncbi:peptidylprolyl isomerase [Psychromonas antarctica]|jgi:cyclophilin family peptidyl-prolyl cis-trans isomerase|uniref:peptidylprolyl isomerase n=1 Tax=Psychromonas antarctica TaxID=67573 RepID=UPI001EE87F5D|nr:peptidylprolyl isomerase [Psychromonas antarctica]MCG6199944.1 peptidylprolyl isomerase [Psychromonas antarctica]
MKQLLSFFLLLISSTTFAANNPSVIIDTSKGQITVELFPDLAPKSVANFLAYVQKDGFKQTIFHRVINGFMIQGGGENESGKKFDSLTAIENESRNGLSNERGTLAMARTSFPHSATRQFFINQKDNTFLDAKNGNWGYAVFGKVTQGMTIVDSIATVKTRGADRPVQAVTINSITLHGSEIK